MQRDRYRLLAILGAAASLLLIPTASAQSLPRADEGWTFTLTPYVWLLGIEADVGDVDVEPEISGGWDTSIDSALMGMFEARKDRFGLLFDGFYGKLSAEVDTPGPAFADAEVEIVHQFYSLAGAYRIINGHAPIDVVAGLRYVHAKVAGALEADLLAGRSASRSEDWFDGFAGLRVRMPLTDRWSLHFYGDVGAGGSDFTWQAMAGASYRMSERFDLQLGYRYFDIDYDHGSGTERFPYDIALGGPYLSLGIKF